MLGEFKVKRCSRRCFKLDRPLRDGEWYYSVVIEDDEDLLRRDYSAESWTDPPAGALGWWKSQMPTQEQRKLVLAPPEVLVDLLRQLEHRPEQAKIRFLLALMLLRRRLLRPLTRAELDGHRTAAVPHMVLEVIADRSHLSIESPSIKRSEV